MEILPFIMKAKRLSSIERCSNTPHIQNYNVAEHSYFTALLSMLVADMERHSSNGHDYDTSEVIKKALIHDLEESITGDLLFPFKHQSNEKLSKNLNESISFIVETELFQELPESIEEYYVSLWKISKDETKEGKLVAAIDKLEILIFAFSELKMGNSNFIEIFNTAIKILRKDYDDIVTIQNIINEIENEVWWIS